MNLCARAPGCRARAKRGVRPSLIKISHGVHPELISRSVRDDRVFNLSFRAAREILTQRSLLPTLVLGEIVVNGAVALEAPNGALLVPGAREDRFQKRRDLAPGSFGLRRTIATRHGIVEKSVRRLRIDAQVKALSRLG